MDGIENMVANDLGPEGKVFVPLILTVALFVGLANLIGVIPRAFSPPTEDLSTTLALALIVFVVGHVGAIVKNGFWPWLKGFLNHIGFCFPSIW